MKNLTHILTFVFILLLLRFASSGGTTSPRDLIVNDLQSDGLPASSATVEIYSSSNDGTMGGTLLDTATTNANGNAYFYDVQVYDGQTVWGVVTYQTETYDDFKVSIPNDSGTIDEIIVVRLPADGGNGGR